MGRRSRESGSRLDEGRKEKTKGGHATSYFQSHHNLVEGFTSRLFPEGRTVVQKKEKSVDYKNTKKVPSSPSSVCSILN